MVNAYLSPVLRGYVDTFGKAVGGDHAPLLMQSSGGLIDGRAFRGKDALLSGPAGGSSGWRGPPRRPGSNA